MAISRNEEARLLSREEKEVVDKTRRPALQSIGTEELSDLVKRLRDRRKRARDIAHKQRREMRGKAEGGATDNAGTLAKRDVLTAALKRANKEMDRRRSQSSANALKRNAKRALAMKQAAAELRNADNPASGDRTADEGMNPQPNTDIAPSGAIEAEGYRPVVNRTRLPR